MGWRVEPVEWTVTYLVHPDDPIGRIRLEGGGYAARLADEDLGVHDTGDAAVEAVWERYLEQVRMQHDAASRVHGSAERH